MFDYALEFMKKEFPDIEEYIFIEIMRGIIEKYNLLDKIHEIHQK
jgi:hypothetical protein